MKAVGQRLREAYDRGNFSSYKALAREAERLGFRFSPELLARYFDGKIEPGLYALSALVAALGLSADEVLFGDEHINRYPERKRFVEQIVPRLSRALSDSELQSPLQLAIISENLGFKLSPQRIEKILAGQAEPSLFEFTGMVMALKTSSDAILLQKDPGAEAGQMLRETADKLVNLLKKAGAADPRLQELTKLYSGASPKVQAAVLELLRSAARI